jgi:hypothetical protein
LRDQRAEAEGGAGEHGVTNQEAGAPELSLDVALPKQTTQNAVIFMLLGDWQDYGGVRREKQAVWPEREIKSRTGLARNYQV